MKKNNTKPSPRFENECLNWSCGEISLKYEVKERPTVVICSPEDLYKFILKNIDIDELQVQEHFLAFYFDRNLNLLGYKTISTGSTVAITVDLKQIFSVGVILNAQSIMVAHNHPSNNLNPSPADLKITEKIVAAADNLGMSCIDHLIITKYNFLSMATARLVKFY